MSFDPELSFTLRKNDKGNNPKRPDYRGECQVGGVTYEIAGWIRTRTSDGTKFISGKLKPKEKKAEPKPSSEDDKPFEPQREEDQPFT